MEGVLFLIDGQVIVWSVSRVVEWSGGRAIGNQSLITATAAATNSATATFFSAR